MGHPMEENGKFLLLSILVLMFGMIATMFFHNMCQKVVSRHNSREIWVDCSTGMLSQVTVVCGRLPLVWRVGGSYIFYLRDLT